ncbi:MAG TPA: cellulose synthase catalytic subunit (UDP-forming) [Cyanobacteria bacterium UBA8553]|nr:cellulose synthase catalytic subunit (UDP-forming) [Cyanobacteria bacterium UBA8553]HAJ62344.1 cellulose synthase catalytic subunit (UDP-forming) [Cyanobacteria bacterium UBA8543]
MSSSSNPNSLRPRRQRLSAITWLVELLPRFFDRTLGWMGFSHLKWIILLLFVLSIPLITTPLKVWQQGLVAVLLIAVGQIVVRIESRQSDEQTSEYLHLFLVWLSIVTTLRYLYYRTAFTLNFNSWLNGIFCLLLFAAELYAIITLILAYFQTLKLKDREPIDLSLFPENEWFKVDIYIPTYNEDVEIVRKTVLGAIAIEYPEDKKRVYVLDDGRAEKYRARRQELRQMCEELGVMMLTRDNNEHAKAGNINTAFRRTKGDLVLILDCDHIPSRQFLMHTVGFFFDPNVAFVQTPHWFYNPDPFERNLLTGGRVPVGNELFYKVLQKGNDFWNAAFFCGSAAVIRKEHALQVGGIATETVTEDCHTAFRLHSLGYESVYYDKIMVAGLAPEKFSSYVGQQVRWARGMAQILRLENPLINPKLNLSLAQRICYFSATSHFFYGYPRLMYAIAPTLFLLFGLNPIQGLGTETLAYALPHILISLNANYITYKNVRFSFWNEVFEFVMAFQAGYVTLMALINPRLGSFNVTDKGLSVTKRSFDWESVRGLLVVAVLVIVSLVAVPFWLILRPEDMEAVLVNGMWCVFNLVLLLAAILVALEQPQLRTAHRLPRRLPAMIHSADQTWSGETINVSETGALIRLDSSPNLPDEVEVEIRGDFGAQAFLTGRIIRGTPINDSQTQLAIDFVNPTRTQQDALVVVIYSDVGEWYSQNREYVDQPLGSLRFLATSLTRALREFNPASNSSKVRKHIRAAAQIYWDGIFYPGEAIEIGINSVRLELDGRAISADKSLEEQDLVKMQQEKPLIGLLLGQEVNDPLPSRLLAQIVEVEKLPFPESSNFPQRTVALELIFPQQYKQRQAGKIKQLLKVLQ